MRTCSRCILPETFPGIRFDGNGVCNFCLGFKGKEHLHAEREAMREKFDRLVNEVRGRATCDVLMCYSGGKDSTYTLSLLRKKFHLKALAVTFDNGFVPEEAFVNIRKVCEVLSVDHLFVKPRFDLLRRIFAAASERALFPRKALERASTICTACMGIVKFGALRLAIEQEIPVVSYGWSPGQAPIASSVFRHNPTMLRSMQKALYGPVHEIVGEDIRPYFLEERHFADPSKLPYNVSPLAFCEYSEEKILQEITGLGWRRPRGLDANSSNCMLNSYANLVHKRQFGFHPYAWEMSNLIRAGQLDRTDALRKTEDFAHEEAVRLAEEKIFVGDPPRAFETPSAWSQNSKRRRT